MYVVVCCVLCISCIPCVSNSHAFHVRHVIHVIRYCVFHARFMFLAVFVKFMCLDGIDFREYTKNETCYPSYYSTCQTNLRMMWHFIQFSQMGMKIMYTSLQIIHNVIIYKNSVLISHHVLCCDCVVLCACIICFCYLVGMFVCWRCSCKKWVWVELNFESIPMY